MKIRILIALFLHINCWFFSQYRCPLNSGRIILSKMSLYGHQDETKNRIKSDSNQVISVSNGEVVKIIKSDSDYSLIIKNDKNNFFIYSNLSKILLKENDTVDKNELLGLANYDEYYTSYVIDFQFWEKDESVKIDLKCTKSN